MTDIRRTVRYCYPDHDSLEASRSTGDGCPACGHGAKGRPATLYAYGAEGIAKQVGSAIKADAVRKLAGALDLGPSPRCQCWPASCTCPGKPDPLADPLVVAAIIAANRGRAKLDRVRTQAKLDELHGVSR
jgi:hypothetical protein